MALRPSSDSDAEVKAEPGTLNLGRAAARRAGCASSKMYRRLNLLDPVRHWFVPYRVER